jgi:hypothetical protein
MRHPYFVRKHEKKAKKAMDTLSEKGIGPKITKFDIKSNKSSDTVFILGSGSSINNIDGEQWSHISQHDSIGLNRWPVHHHTPTFLVFEIRMDSHLDGFRSKYWHLLNYKKKEYQDVPIILKDTSVVCEELDLQHLPTWLKGDLIVSCDSAFSRIIGLNSSIPENNKLLQYLNEAGFFEQNSVKTIYRKRGSISYLLHLSVILGYENIVLCGVDLDDSNHFFVENKDEYSNIPVPRKPQDNTDEGKHLTNDPKEGSLTIDKIIHSLNEIVLTPRDIDLFIESRDSALYPGLELYKY